MNEDNVVYVDPDLEELIPGFLENRQQDIVRIGEFLAEGNLTEIQRIGHSMKGSGGGYGFDEISRIGSGIEEAAKQVDTTEIEKLNSQLGQYLSTVKIVWHEED